MTKIKIKTIVWDDFNVEHIKKHRVGVPEIEGVKSKIIYHRKTKKDRYLAVGRSGSRILTLILSRKAKTTYYLVSAHDSGKKERRKVYEKENI